MHTTTRRHKRKPHDEKDECGDNEVACATSCVRDKNYALDHTPPQPLLMRPILLLFTDIVVILFLVRL